MAENSQVINTTNNQKLTELAEKISKIEQHNKMSYSSVTSSITSNQPAVQNTSSTNSTPHSTPHTSSQRAVNRVTTEFSPDRCIVISSNKADNTNIRALTQDKIRHTLGANHGPLMIEFINRYNFRSNKPKFLVQLASKQAVNDVISNWKIDSFGGSEVRSTIKPNDGLLQGMAKGIPLDIDDDTIKSALDEQYPGSKHTRLVKNERQLRTVNIHFVSSEMKTQAVNKGLLIKSYNMLFCVEPLHHSAVNNGQQQ